MKKQSKRSKRVKRTSSLPQRPTSSFERLPTGIPGLDTILRGGFLRGGTYLILGAPGAGKTIFANQLSFSEIRAGRRALYVTLLAENHGRMFGHLESLTFFDRSLISDQMQYVSGYNVLEKDGLEGLLKLLGVLAQRHQCSVIFVDGVASADELSDSPISFKKFVHNLNSVLGISGCTTFLLSSVQGSSSRPEYTMVDGIVSLTHEQSGMRTVREIEVPKFRGSGHLYGRHFFDITEQGITIYPRVEAALEVDARPIPPSSKRLKLGDPKFDSLMGGGLVPGSVTALLGPAGTGKTTIGTRFLEEGASQGELGMFVNFYEHIDRLDPKLKSFGSRFGSFVKSGAIQVIRHLPSEYLLDKVVYEILRDAREKKARRIFIDGSGALKEKGIIGKERLFDVMKAMFAEFRHLGVTTVFTEETDAASGPHNAGLSYDSAISDNIIEFRHAQIHDRRTQIIQVLKSRESALDPGFYELVLTKKGPRLGQTVEFTEPFLPVVQYSGGPRAKGLEGP